MIEVALDGQQMVYVVDDDAAIRDSLTWLLEAHGFRVVAFPVRNACIR